MEKYVFDVKPVSERIIALKLMGNPGINLVSVHAPTATAEDAKKDQCWKSLKETQTELDKMGPTYIMGDMNARVLIAQEGEEEHIGTRTF